MPFRLLTRRAAVYDALFVVNFCKLENSDIVEVPDVGKLYNVNHRRMKNKAYKESLAAMAAVHAVAREAVAAW